MSNKTPERTQNRLEAHPGASRTEWNVGWVASRLCVLAESRGRLCIPPWLWNTVGANRTWQLALCALTSEAATVLRLLLILQEGREKIRQPHRKNAHRKNA